MRVVPIILEKVSKIVGHTTVSEYRQCENVHLIDTGATYQTGYFTILDLETLTPVDISKYGFSLRKFYDNRSKAL